MIGNWNRLSLFLVGENQVHLGEVRRGSMVKFVVYMRVVEDEMIIKTCFNS